MKHNFDARDRELLAMLATYPEWTYEKIGEKMGMTSRSVGYRIERLREMKIIQKANLIYYDRLGDWIYAAVLKFATGIPPEEQTEAIHELKANRATIQVFAALGSFSVILLIHAENTKEVERIMQEMVVGNSHFESHEISQITEIFSIYRQYVK
jgi:DNA-binding Lrp family transcriptional regulator